MTLVELVQERPPLLHLAARAVSIVEPTDGTRRICHVDEVHGAPSTRLLLRSSQNVGGFRIPAFRGAKQQGSTDVERGNFRLVHVLLVLVRVFHPADVPASRALVVHNLRMGVHRMTWAAARRRGRRDLGVPGPCASITMCLPGYRSPRRRVVRPRRPTRRRRATSCQGPGTEIRHI